MAVALLIGGGGSPEPRAELAVELAAIGAAVLWSFLPAEAPVHIDRLPIAFVAALPGIALLHLVPLPPLLWQGLPGRETELAALELVGAAGQWMPVSMTPDRTLASALSLIPPLVVLAFVARAPLVERTKLLAVVVAAAALSAMVGVAQVASGSAGALRFYGSRGFDYASGLFANRNAAADLLVSGIVAMLALAAARPELLRTLSARLAWSMLALFLLLSVLLTRSRAGMMLALVPLVLAPLMLRPWRFRRRQAFGWAAGTLVIGSAALALASGAPALRHSWERLALAPDNRADLRIDTLHAIARSWPAGTGIGSFVPVFAAAERLETVDPTAANRAHNDYLEFTLEAGAAAPLLLLAAAAAVLRRAAPLLRAGVAPERRAQLLFALATLGIFALHALVDYPMRAMTLACVAAIAIGMLAHPPRRREVA
ncbi:O-antigen ligase family protein [Sphingomonas desiccabilis]|uniref:O-antigen ligase family protein n=1 Tax=Sphingomonas desiccabilis TaxID=429134 RepID=UPI0013EA1650|nr:O-antigen ligase family protein [Sphingomonas desiccabilis]MBB3911069.1 hypothetical protein [Sphingomonas desiccabilis]